jgi:hypothetical protein
MLAFLPALCGSWELLGWAPSRGLWWTRGQLLQPAGSAFPPPQSNQRTLTTQAACQTKSTTLSFMAAAEVELAIEAGQDHERPSRCANSGIVNADCSASGTSEWFRPGRRGGRSYSKKEQLRPRIRSKVMQPLQSGPAWRHGLLVSRRTATAKPTMPEGHPHCASELAVECSKLQVTHHCLHQESLNTTDCRRHTRPAEAVVALATHPKPLCQV